MWSEEACFKHFVEKTFNQKLHRFPERLANLGINKHQNKWNDYSQESLKKEHEFNKKALEKLLTFDVGSLSEESQLDWKIFKKILENQIEDYKYRFYRYRENQLFGRHSALNAFLINKHKINSKQSAKDYIERVRAIKKDLEDLDQHLLLARDQGIIPPRVIFPKVKSNIYSFLKGAPLDMSGEDHFLVENFKKKIQTLKLSHKKKEKLIHSLNQVLKEFYKPAFEKHLKTWEQLYFSSRAKEGIWQHPGGDDYYSFLLKKYTTTELTPEQIHQMGVKEVRRIHQQIIKLKERMSFKGSLLEFFNDFRNNKKFYYSKPDQYVSHAEAIVLRAEKALPRFFNLLPKHSIKVKPVESFRAGFTAIAFYHPSSADGERPAFYYINLSNLRELPNYRLKALSYHEAVPGHHLQLSIAMMNENISKFRRYGHFFKVFIEGWALYAEKLAQEMGLYSSDYDEFGRLSMELMRACRLVVDTGIHHKKWTREQAIEYLIKNSDASYESNVRSVERYIVNPGQAVSYMIGFLKILELRKWAEEELKDQFDIKKFHDKVLSNGAVPLDILEENIRSWVEDIRRNDSIFFS